MFFPTAIAALAFASYASAHMIMATPVPYSKDSLTNSPLSFDGTDFPCKLRDNAFNVTTENAMTLGSTQPLSFIGSATHGGGSCQVSIAYDRTPSTSTTWKVIHSIEGGCPIMGVAGNTGGNADAIDPDTYNFTIPTNIPTGEATLAWTWFNKVGNREMYMNCAPITLSSGSSKRDADLETRDSSAYDALPDMFTANIDNGGCGTVDSTDLVFFNPGDSVERDGLATSGALTTATGSTCKTAVAASISVTAGSDSGSSVTAAATSAATPVATSASGGAFATVASSAAPAAATTAAPAAASVVASSAAPAASASSGATGTGSVQTAGSACSTEGEFNCIAGTSYQQCASGVWSVVMSVAAGTTCTSGLSTDLNVVAIPAAKRNVRFSREHIGRHIHH